MKKVLLSALLAVSLITSSFATVKNKISVVIRNNFKSEFRHATNVNWNTTNDYVTASFVEDEKRMLAFYNFDGTLIGASHAITEQNLPANAKRAFAKKYSNYTVKEIVQFDSSNETAYFISAQNENKSLVLKVVNGQISVFK